MALSAKIVGFACPGVTGNFAVTGVGFQPKFILFLTTASTAALPATDTPAQIGFGTALSSTDRRCMFTVSGGAQTTSYTLDSTAAFRVDQTTTVFADLVSMDADGFTLNFSATTTGLTVSALCLGGASLTDVKGGKDTRRTTVGTKATTGIGFQPQGLLVFAPSAGVTDPVAANASTGGAIGGASSPTQRGVTSFHQVAFANPTQSHGWLVTDSVYQSISSTAVATKADLTSFDVDGFTLNWTTVNATAALFEYVAFRGMSMRVGAFNQPVTNTIQTITVGFVPVAVLLLSSNAVAGVGITANCRQSIGAFTAGEQHTVGQFEENGTAPPDRARSFYSRTQALRLGAEAASGMTSAGDATVTGIGSDNFTLSWANTDGTSREVVYFAFGEPTATVDTPTGSVVFTGRAVNLAHRIGMPAES